MSKAKKIICIIVVTTLIMVSCSFSVFAATKQLILPFNVPQLTGNDGYIELMFRNSSGTEWVNIIGWQIFSVYNDTTTFMNIELYNNRLYLKPILVGEEIGAFTTYRCTTDGGFHQYSYLYQPNASDSFDVTNLVAYRVHGNVKDVNIDVGQENFNVVYSPTNTITLKLDEIIILLSLSLKSNDNLIANNNDNTNKVINNQEQNTNEIKNNQDKNASNIQSNQDKNTQSIIDNQNQLQENEKTEANNGGNSNVGDLTSAIPSDTDGFLNAFSNLTNCMLHTNTNCVISFPQIKTPAIAGIIPSYTLSEVKEINFEETVDLIPIAILSIVRALLTIALIVFCFKELYSTVSYVLTLKGGASE